GADRDATRPPEPRPSVCRALGVRRPATARRKTQLARCRHAPALDVGDGIVRRLIFGTMKDGVKPADNEPTLPSAIKRGGRFLTCRQPVGKLKTCRHDLRPLHK